VESLAVGRVAVREECLIRGIEKWILRNYANQGKILCAERALILRCENCRSKTLDQQAPARIDSETSLI
jgi:hypothetical protein